MTVSGWPLRFYALLAALLLLGSPAGAQDFSARPIRIVIPFVAGGATDVIGRLLGERLAARLNTGVVVENRAGANGNIGAEAVVRAEPDGHTLLFATAGVLAVNASLYPNLPFSVIADLAPVSKVYDTGNVLVVHPSVPATSLAELVALARAQPGRLSFASGGSGSSSHLFGALFLQLTGTQMAHVPYRSNGPALNDVIAGNVPLMFDQVPSTTPQARAGRVRALAITTAARVAALPEVPTVAEAGLPDLTGTFWVALTAPSRTPAPAIAALNRAVVDSLGEPALRERLAGLGADPAPSTPEELGALIAADTARWGRVVRAGNLRPD